MGELHAAVADVLADDEGRGVGDDQQAVQLALLHEALARKRDPQMRDQHLGQRRFEHLRVRGELIGHTRNNM